MLRPSVAWDQTGRHYHRGQDVRGPLVVAEAKLDEVVEALSQVRLDRLRPARLREGIRDTARLFQRPNSLFLLLLALSTFLYTTLSFRIFCKLSLGPLYHGAWHEDESRYDYHKDHTYEYPEQKIISTTITNSIGHELHPAPAKAVIFATHYEL